MTNDVKLTNKLFKIKQEIDSAKEKKTKLETELSIFLDKLKKEFDFDSIEDAEKELKRLEEVITVEQYKLEKKFEKLQNCPEWA